jgi:tetratricopeptide (TPR) repeat protein
MLGNLFMLANQHASAADVYKKVVESGADENDVYRLRLIDMYTRTRQFESARAQFDALDPSNKDSLVGMLQNAEIESGLGNRARASQIIDEAVAEYSNNSMVYIKRAGFNVGVPGAMADVLSDIDTALQINPNDWRAYQIRASAYHSDNQRPAAIRDLQKAVRLNPSLDKSLYGILNEFMIDGRNAEAYDFAIEIVQERELDATLVENLGRLFSSRGDWDRAAVFFKNAWDIQRSPAAGATLIDAIVRTRNPDTALANAVIKDLSEVAGKIDENPGLLAAQALVLQARGRDELALQQLTKAFDLSSNDDVTLQQWSGNISRFFEDKPMRDQLSYLETLKQRNPNQEVLNWLDLFLAQRLVTIGAQKDSAQAVLDRLTMLDSQPELQRNAMISLGASAYANGDIDKAIAVWSRGAESFPEEWEMSNNLAYLLSVERGEHERALQLARNAIAANPTRSEPYDTIGKIYTALEQYDKAQEMLSTGMEYALSARSRVTLVLAQIELDLAQGFTAEAGSKLSEIRTLLLSMPTRDPGLEKQADEIGAKIDSAG